MVLAGEQLTLKTGEASIVLKGEITINGTKHPSESIRRPRLNRSEDPAELNGTVAATLLAIDSNPCWA